jgi:hypothetical protein
MRWGMPVGVQLPRTARGTLRDRKPRAALIEKSPADTGRGAGRHGGMLKILFDSVSGHMRGADLAFPVGAVVGGVIYRLITHSNRKG